MGSHNLISFGFWRARDDDAADARPWPLASAAALPAAARALVRRYLTAHAFVESFELAPAACRLACGARAIGHATLTDGVFVWPEGFVHYFDAHGVLPPRELVEAALTAAAAAAGDAWEGADGSSSGGGRGGGVDDERVRAWAVRGDELLAPRNHLLWEAGGAVALPRATREYLSRVAWAIDVRGGGSSQG
jgi:hypothetical protein